MLSLIRAKTEKGLRAAMHGLEGKLSGEVKRLRHELALILSDIEVDVDFAHEDLDLDVGSVNDIRQRLININNSMARF